MIQYTIRERLQFCLDKKYLAGAILMDLFKAFDTIDHQLIIAKLFANGISTDARENQDQYNFEFLDSVISRSSTWISSWSNIV